MELRYFKLEEFDSPDYPGSGEKFMDWEFLDCLDEARDIAGVQFKINSGYIKIWALLHTIFIYISIN